MPTETPKNPNIVHIFLYTLLTSALIISFYLNTTNFDKAVAHSETFESLPKGVQALYISKVEYKELQDANEELEKKCNRLEMTNEVAYEDNVMPVESLVSVAADEFQEQSVESVQSIEPAQDVVKVKEFAKCYTMDNASYKISKECRTEITDYVDAHADAKYFEIIGIVDNLEFNLFNNLEKKQELYEVLGVDQRVVNKLKKLTRRGLSKERASEASWVIKAHTGRKAATYNANYELISEKGYRGVVIRAYK